MSEFVHIPIMLDEVLELLKPWRGGLFVDGTLAGGGHAEAVLSRLPKGSRLIGIDRDREAIQAATKRLEGFGDKFGTICGNFFDMKTLLNGIGVTQVDGILLDLGVSSHQIDTKERGFSYNTDAPLDMRMDTEQALSAYDVVNTYTFERLATIIREYGEERYAGKVASAILRAREQKPIESTKELVEIVKRTMGKAAYNEAQHPARRTFQAIRIEVNAELDGLEEAIRNAESLLSPGGVLAIITFHSLEDRVVKQTFKSFENPCVCDRRAPVCTCGKKPTSRILTKKPLIASETEMSDNYRSHSAKLRAIEKL